MQCLRPLRHSGAHYCPVDVDGCVLGPPCPLVLDQLQVSDILPLIVVGDQAYHRCVSKLDNGVGVVRYHTVVGEEGVQEGTKHTF